jgi:hypothetical protein
MMTARLFRVRPLGRSEPAGTEPRLLRTAARGLGARITWTPGVKSELMEALERGEEASLDAGAATPAGASCAANARAVTGAALAAARAAKRDEHARAGRLEWVTIACLAPSIALVYFAVGPSQAVKTAWVEDVLSLALRRSGASRSSAAPSRTGG